MYSVRKTTKKYGNTNLYVLIFILIITSILYTNYGVNYLVVFLSSSILHIVIESGLTITGIRKGRTFLFGKTLPRGPEILLRSTVEGPAYCVPAYFVADQFVLGNTLFAVVAVIIVVGGVALYMALSDRRNLKKLLPPEQAIVSRRAMTNPKAVMLLALLNTICIALMFLIPTPFRLHAFVYLFSYAGLVMLYYFINYNLGVRFIETYDPVKKEYSKPGVFMQIGGLTYDSAYEMALLISPAYWIPFYLGLFS